MSNNQSIGNSFVFTLNECLPSFYNEFIVAQYYKDISTNITTISLEFFNNDGCFGKPTFHKKWVGTPPFQDHIPFMLPSEFNTTDPQNFTIDIVEPQSIQIPLNSVIVQLFPYKGGNTGCALGVYGYVIYSANSTITANGETSQLSCVDGVPQSKTCVPQGCYDPLIINTCLVSSVLSILGYCSNSTTFPYK